VQQVIHPEFRAAAKRLPLLWMSRGTLRFVRPLLGLARSLVCQRPIPDRRRLSWVTS
jgi:hypothetical protein